MYEVFPIQTIIENKLYSIHGAKLPLPASMSEYEEEEISTALGYCAHIIVMLAKYLQVIVFHTLAPAMSTILIWAG